MKKERDKYLPVVFKRWIHIAIIFIVFTPNLFSQQTFMRVCLKNGQRILYPIDDVRKLTFDGLIDDVKDQQMISSVMKSFTLSQNYPNPITAQNSSTTIEYELSKPGTIDVKIFDVSGKLIRNLTHDFQETGAHTVQWNGKDDRGKQLSAGLYFYQVQFGRDIITKKLILIK